MKRFAGNVKEIAGFPVVARKDVDGHKLFIEGGWLLLRASGTEPLIRVYAEADSMARVERLLSAVTSRNSA